MAKTEDSFKRALLNQLRKRISDPGARGTADTSSFTGDGSTKKFTLDQKPLIYISSVTVDGATMRPHSDFDIDFATSGVFGSIIFHTAPAMSAAIEVSFVYGSNWIYTHEPSVEVTYPAISFERIGGAPEELSGGGKMVFKSPEFRIGVFVLKDPVQTYTIGGVVLFGATLLEYLNQQVAQACASIRYELDIAELHNLVIDEPIEPEIPRDYKVRNTFRTASAEYFHLYS